MKLPAFIAIVAWAYLSQQTMAQQITNGSFDGFTGNTNSDNGTLPSGWTRVSGHPDTLDANSSVFGNWDTSNDGGCFVKCDFTNDYPGSGYVWIESFSQTVNGFIPGNTYTLSFEQACFPFYTNETGDMGFWKVNIGGVVYESEKMPISTSGASPWVTRSFEFEATAVDMDFIFAAAGTGSWASMAIDGIAITVPEPSSASLFGLVGVSLLLRRRRFQR